jgi:endonuclease-8
MRNIVYHVLRTRAAYRQAAALRTALIGRSVRQFSAPGLDGINPAVGHVIEEVRFVGRAIEIVWDDSIVVATRLRLLGTWHLYRPGEVFRRSVDCADVVIDVGIWIAVCFGASSVEAFKDFDPRRHPMLGSVGPDMANDDIDLEDCVDRMMHYQERDATIAEVLVDHRVIVNVGNVYRCEALWACEIHPWAPIGDLKRAECREVITLLREMVVSDSRSSLAVYGRQGKACLRCAGLIKVTHHGEANRVLYWCPDCQTAHQPLMRSNFTPMFIDRHDKPNDSHPAVQMFMDEISQRRAGNF